MGAARFVRYEFRTTKVDAAKKFYTAILGRDLWAEVVTISELPAQAVARGARAHWLGHLGVADVESTAQQLIARGAQPLGPIHQHVAILREPFGALLGLSADAAPPSRDVVSWHALHTQDHARAFSIYSSLFGWTPTQLVDLGPDQGQHQGFSWDGSGNSAGGNTVGSISNAARLPGIHPQWLFFFRVEDLEERLAAVRGQGGTTLEPIRTATGLLAACDDPEGAAFGLIQRAPS